MLAKDPARRPADAREVVELLTPRSTLSSAHLTIQRSVAARLKEDLEIEAGGALINRMAQQREYAKRSLDKIWEQFVNEVRVADPTLRYNFLDDGRLLRTGNSQIVMPINEALPIHEDFLLSASVFVDPMPKKQSFVAANLVARLEEEPSTITWTIVRWSLSALPTEISKGKKLSEGREFFGLKMDVIETFWRRRSEMVPPLIADTRKATGMALLELFAECTELD